VLTYYYNLPLGTPTGKIEKVAGVNVYVATPSGEYDKEKALLYLPGLYSTHQKFRQS